MRTASPPVPDAEPDRELLARVMAQPRPQRRRRPIAIPAVAVAALLAAAFVMLGGDRPDTAVALSQAMHWFDPPAGKVLHTVMTDDAGNTREFWQDVDHPERSRMIEPGGYEVAERAIYEAATNTIYTDDGTRKGDDVTKLDAAKRAKLAREGRTGTEPKPAAEAEAKAKAKAMGESETRPAPSGAKKPAETVPRGDPVIAKVRVLIAEGRAVVRGREEHNGVQAWKITLADTAERAPWVLWVSAEDGKPLAIDDPGDPARNKAPEHARWTKYDVLDRSDAPLTLREAHPDARVENDPAQFDAMLARMESR